MSNSTDAYRVLGLERGASAEQIKKAWRARVKGCHPDVVATESASVQKAKAAEYRQLTEAYEGLMGRGGGSGGGVGSASSSRGASSNSHTWSAYYRAEGTTGRTTGRTTGSFAARTARSVRSSARNSWQNGGILVLSCVFFVGLTAFEPIIEGWWDQRNAGKLFKDIAKGAMD
jgi:curved DNA-binding protein CbpA